MIVHRKILALLAFAALLLGAGCGGSERQMFTAETDDPDFRQGQQLVRQGREPEALSAFLKVIEKRGEQSSAESHLYAATIYLQHIKDPVEAIHHFRKYLELQPNSQQAPFVRGQMEAARREFARPLPAHPLESEVVGLDQSDQIKILQREVDDLKAENAALHALVPTPGLRTTRTTVDTGDSIPNIVPAPSSNANSTPQISIAPPSQRQNLAPNPIIAPASQRSSSLIAPPVTRGGGAGQKSVATSGRKHTVTAHETLFGIAKKYGVKMEDIVDANPQVLKAVNSPLPVGTELRIP